VYSLLSCWAVGTRNIYRQVHHAPAGGGRFQGETQHLNLPLRGHPREQTVTSRPSREAAVAATGSSSSSRSTGPDRGRFWRSQAAQARLVAAAGRPPSPSAGHITHRHIHRHIHRHAGHLRGVAGAASRAEGGSREHLGVQGAADADRRRRFRGLASAGALWAPGIHTVPGHVHLQRRVDVATAAAVVAAISVQSQPQFQLLQL
jgi:hypothetical protein